MTIEIFNILLLVVLIALFSFFLWIGRPIVVRRYKRMDFQRLPFGGIRNEPKLLEQAKTGVIQRKQQFERMYRILKIVLPLYTLLAISSLFILWTIGHRGLWVHLIALSGYVFLNLFLALRMGLAIIDVLIERLSIEIGSHKAS